jgi:hypothetical protein
MNRLELLVRPFQIFGTDPEHKAEHNNCRLRTPEPDLEALSPTESDCKSLKRVRAA